MATPEVVQPCRCARSPANRSCLWGSASASPRSSRSTPSVSPGASSAWATLSVWSRRPPRRSTKTKPKSLPPSSKRVGSISTTSPPSCGKSAAWAEWAGCCRCFQGSPSSKAAGRSKYRRGDHQTPGGNHLVDDQKRTTQPEAAERLPPPAHSQRVGHLGAGDQSAPQAVSGHGGHHEAYEEAGRQGHGAARPCRAHARRVPPLVGRR